MGHISGQPGSSTGLVLASSTYVFSPQPDAKHVPAACFGLQKQASQWVWPAPDHHPVERPALCRRGSKVLIPTFLQKTCSTLPHPSGPSTRKEIPYKICYFLPAFGAFVCVMCGVCVRLWAVGLECVRLLDVGSEGEPVYPGAKKKKPSQVLRIAIPCIRCSAGYLLARVFESARRCAGRQQ